MLTAEQILSINPSFPWKLFSSGEEKIVETEFRGLARRWHPDISHDDGSVFRHILVLRDNAFEAIKSGKWNTIPEVTFHGVDGRRRSLKYVSKWPHDAGMTYLGNSYVMHVIDPGFPGNLNAIQEKIKNLNYPNADLENQFKLILPNIVTEFKAETGEYIIVMKRPDNMVRLSDLVRHLNGTLDPRHVAWILRRCASIICLLNYNSIVHPDISMDTCFVDPENHLISLIGGWWFADTVGSKLSALPARSVSVMPESDRRNKTLSVAVSLEAVHLLGRELLGFPSGVGFPDSIPKPLVNWLRVLADVDPVQDYKNLDHAVEESFGPRRFVDMGVKVTDVQMEV